MTFRYDIINHFISLYKYSTYLEIGVRLKRSNFNRIKCKSKEGVDPNPRSRCNHIMTSDKFFKLNKRTYDIIFIDGLHLHDQVSRDIQNALDVLNDNGTIVIHDCNPTSENQTITTPEFMAKLHTIGKKPWLGDGWKAFAYLRMTRPDLNMFTVDTDYGCGIIRRGQQKLFTPVTEIKDLNFEFLDNNRSELLLLTDWKTL